MEPFQKLSPEGVTLTDFLKILKNRWPLIFVFVLISVLIAATVTYFMPKWFMAVTGIRVEKPEGAVSVFQHQTSSNFDPYFIQEQFEIIQSKKILKKVIESLDLQKLLQEKLGGFLSLEDTYYYMLKRMLDVKSRPGTSLIDIGVLVQEDPDLAALIANEIARIYAEDRIAFATSGQTEGIKRLKVELHLQETIVSQQRDVVENLRKKWKITGVDLNAETTQLERTHIALRVDTMSRKTRWELFKSIPAEERFKMVNSELIPDPNIQNLMQAYLVAEQNYARLKGRFGEAHPDFIGATESLNKIREQLADLLEGYKESLKISYLEAKARTEELERQLVLARADQILDAQSRMRSFQDAVQKLRDEENLLKTFRLTLRQREIDFQVPKRTIEVLNEAVAPLRAAKPNWIINVGLSFVVGIVLGVGCAFLVEFFDTSFRSVDDMERKLQLPVLGVVTKNLVIVDEGNFRSFETEPFRVIQTNLELAREDLGGNVLAVQSAGSGEGKSTTLYNLGVVMALGGQKVLVIDSDLRRPSQHQLFEKPRKPGLIDLLTGQNEVEEYIVPTKFDNLYLLPSGGGSHFSLSILHGRKLATLLEKLRHQYDKILLDSPPVIGISDSSVLASHVDGVIFIVQHRRNPQSMTLRAKQILENVEARILGTVLNQVPETGDEDYNYYTSNYNYYSSRDDSDSDSSEDELSIDNDVEAIVFQETESGRPS